MKSEAELLREHGLKKVPSKLSSYKKSKLEVGQHCPIITKRGRKITFEFTGKEGFGAWVVRKNEPA